jgi:HptB-dependent secretion and biofilm anti anti-sigma factor
MAVTVTTSGDGAEVRIRITERFDFNIHRDFRNAYEQSGKRGARYVLDLRDTSYMDSSALGMLLQLRDYAGGANNAVHIVNAAPPIREVLRIANFEQVMSIT